MTFITAIPKDFNVIEDELKKLCYRHDIVMIEFNSKKLSIASYRKPNDELLTALRFISSVPVCYDIWPKEKIEHYFNRCNHEVEIQEEPIRYDPSINNEEKPNSPAVNYVDYLIGSAIEKRASDIHIEPFKTGAKIRIRVDGKLFYVPSPPVENCAEIFARLKILAKLNIAEKRLPQDGQLEWISRDIHYAIRISTLPTLYGEKIVLRILNTKNHYSLEQLGIKNNFLVILKQKLSLPQGMILVTGPTGSGKTVTLYSCLEYLNHSELNISTIEDPVEIPIKGINQIPVSEKIGLDFSTILRALLRQDPDIIMVGEIRDQKTAEIAIKAAQTGHLVLSTLHTNSTKSTLERLENLSISPHFINSCVKLIIAQRLVRKLCPSCKRHEENSVTIQYDNIETVITTWRAVGCDHCFGGYLGRTAIYEFLQLKEETLATQFYQLPIKTEKIPFVSLFASGLLLVKAGITTLKELYEVTGQEIIQ
ncbi:ATPase, T2SS/T4P/T4SS family [Arsenophonus sp.]|nr:ATPase, T2SS/T4P/T4SS family [Arsenophonus sp.]MDR5617615.1 ATPase, T2SS/T4P/T4SS family [Arsenophonus sp.]